MPPSDACTTTITTRCDAHSGRHQRLQRRPKAQDPQGPHALQVHLQMMDFRTGAVHHRPNPSNAGTEHLEGL
jgi:hypothetical protein